MGEASGSARCAPGAGSRERMSESLERWGPDRHRCDSSEQLGSCGSTSEGRACWHYAACGAGGQKGVSGLGEMACCKAWSQGPGGGSERLRTVAGSSWVIFAEAELGGCPVVGLDEGQARVLGVLTNVGDAHIACSL